MYSPFSSSDRDTDDDVWDDFVIGEVNLRDGDDNNFDLGERAGDRRPGDLRLLGDCLPGDFLDGLFLTTLRVVERAVLLEDLSGF